MSIIRGVKDRRFKFVQLLNSMFEDPDLSLKAKGFIGYCLTKPSDWVFHVSHLCSVLKEGEKAIYSVISECIKNGYAYRFQDRSVTGQTGSMQIFVSDSKTEIEQIKKDIESHPNFKKCLPDRHFGVADKSVAEDVSISNNIPNSNIQKEQQHTAPPNAAVFSEKNKKEPAKPFVYEILDNVDIPIVDKIEISRRYSKEVVQNAIGWAMHPKNPPNKCLAASIKFACKSGLSGSEFDKKKETVYETLKQLFTNGNFYNNAECFLNAYGIGFARGNLNEGVKFDKYYSPSKFHALLEMFQIDLTQIA